MEEPKNITEKRLNIIKNCEDLQRQFPLFLRDWFTFLGNSLLPLTKRDYLHDVKIFFDYLTDDGGLFSGTAVKDVTFEQFKTITASDVNSFFIYCQAYEKNIEKNGQIQNEFVHNKNTTIARKKAAITNLFAFLHRRYGIEDITSDFDKIKVSKKENREIKCLEENEIMLMLDAVNTGQGLTAREKKAWEKTKYRDKAILSLFVVCALRQSELQQLNLSSFDFTRGEFLIFRKRSKESYIPMNNMVQKAVLAYIENERPETDEEALFISGKGNRLSERQIINIVKKYTSIGRGGDRNSGYSPHKLRATAATSLLRSGASVYDVQELMDHSNVSTTQLYAKRAEGAKRNLVKKLEFEEE